MANNPKDLKYTKDHEWVKIEGEYAIIGITDYAQSQLGDIVYVELPKVNQKYNKGETISTLEAVKTAADVYAPITCEVIEVNEILKEHPEKVNQEPYGAGWIAKVKILNKNELNELLNAEKYENLIQ
ncbi:MAG: glycine cleavage system protein GcvH [candidate division WOR-3 bacterium]|nr:glycine cleavage system protein GcvH [candidate division WOR-3 bacterium]MCX7948111.1 glycine cleavage system protein GcvH [candidate division WOR-3 bacterium]MDW8150811.1 glycine cleavage system protein GcvH [candidate division WOR-3 bacterium]